MAIVTRTCSARGATVTFTVDDATLRGTLVEWTTVNRFVKIVIFDSQGGILQEINPARNSASSVVIDQPARLVQITRSDLTTKSYPCVPFAVYF